MPFALTEDQNKAVRHVLEEMQLGNRVDALVQGDVGCGKTVVAQIAALGMAMNGYQCAVMCPTLVLAGQHYDDFTNFLAKFGYTAVFLHGGMKVREEKAALAEKVRTLVSEELKKAQLLSPCDFDVQFQQEQNGTIQNANPSQIKFFLVNTNDGKTFFPVFTSIENAKLMNFGKNVQPKQVVRHVKDYEVLFEAPNTKAEGLIINPGKDNIVIPKMMVAHIAGKTAAPKTVTPPSPAPLNVQYVEPTVYPNKKWTSGCI